MEKKNVLSNSVEISEELFAIIEGENLDPILSDEEAAQNGVNYNYNYNEPKV